jgi:porphobilinogen synthase
LRQSAGIRSLCQETTLSLSDLVQPLFVTDQATCSAIPSMPGLQRLSLEGLCREVQTLRDLKVTAVALFPHVDAGLKTPEGHEALNPEGILCKAIKAIKQTAPEMIVISDVALDPYTSHGHDGLLGSKGDVDNDTTVALLSQMALVLSQAGADIVAPSDMMDGRVRAIRHTLDQSGHTHTCILAYAAKYHSAYYGPFRDAVGSSQAAGTPALNKKTYQLLPANRREALLEAKLDEQEGADILMVKPAGLYLDIIHQVREQTLLPVAAYQVSGEYAQICAAAQLGYLSLESCMYESLLAIKRAGASIILSYFAKHMAQVGLPELG